MTEHNKHIDHNKFFSKVEIPFDKTKEDIWIKLSEKIDFEDSGKSIKFNSRNNFIWYAAAACLTLLLGITAFMRYHSVELIVPVGQHLSANLPDGSKVKLNAESVLKYNPYWWRFSRELKLDGEAYFEAKKGKNFSVFSEAGTTSVLGTSFNIYARKNVYQVHCLTGKVKVLNDKGDMKILKPKQSVKIENAQTLFVKEEENIENAVAWIDNKFIFTGVPLSEVFDEIERQFDITIKLENDIQDLFTGNFQRGSSPDKIIDIICKPFGLKYVKTSKAEFFIQKQ